MCICVCAPYNLNRPALGTCEGDHLMMQHIVGKTANPNHCTAESKIVPKGKGYG